MGAQYVIGVNVIPEPLKVMCSPNKNQQFQTCDLPKLKENEDDKQSAGVSTGRRSLQSHISDVENATKKFMVSHRSKSNDKISEPAQLQKENTKRPRTARSPKLVDVLSQSLTISKYRLAVENLKDADVAISPDVEDIGFWQFNNGARAIAAGEEAARKALESRAFVNLLR